VCALWRAQEGQDAKSWSDSDDWDCDYFADKSRFVELPFKVGSEVAVIRSQTSDDKNLYITFERISHYRVFSESARMCFDSCRLSIPDYRWKKDVFMGETAREEAEAALAERMKENG
jgi:hypothetical protein